MTVLLDTSVVVDHLRGHAPATEALRELVRSGRPRLASVLTRAEIIRGLPPRQLPAWQQLTNILTWQPVDIRIADRAGQLADYYRKSHAGIDLVDHLIAATAELNLAELWTRNIRHFPSFPGLSSPYGAAPP